jgi:hypothetical protein
MQVVSYTVQAIYSIFKGEKIKNGTDNQYLDEPEPIKTASLH